MIFVRRVTGDSMTPTLRSGQIVLCHQIRNFKKGQIVVAFVGGREVVKRIGKIEKGTVYLVVDDDKHKHAGEFYAKIPDSKVEGIVFWPRLNR